jgi:hypothetical protein
MKTEPAGAQPALTEPWRTLHKRLIVLGAAILKERHWGEPLKRAEAEKQDDALAKLAMEARSIADRLAAALPQPPAFDSQQVTAMWQAFTRTADYRRALAWAGDSEAPGALFVAFRSGLAAQAVASLPASSIAPPKSVQGDLAEAQGHVLDAASELRSLPPPDNGVYYTAAQVHRIMRATMTDAARYLWLRAEHALQYPVAAVVWKRDNNRTGNEWVNSCGPESLDAAIDSMRAGLSAGAMTTERDSGSPTAPQFAPQSGSFERSASGVVDEQCEWWDEGSSGLSASDASSSAASELRPLFDLTLDECASGLLRDTIGSADEDGAPSSVRLQVGDGHSGYGLYVSAADYPEEGAIFLMTASK